MNEQLAAIKARRDAANPETWGAARARMALDDITTLLAIVKWLADESLMWELQHDKRNTQLAAVTAERDALAAQLAQAQRELAAADMALMDAIHERE